MFHISDLEWVPERDSLMNCVEYGGFTVKMRVASTVIEEMQNLICKSEQELVNGIQRAWPERRGTILFVVVVFTKEK